MKILLVDADSFIRSRMKEVIREAGRGWEVPVEAEDAQSALLILQEYQNIDLLITDIAGIGMDGIDFIEKVRECFTKVKIMVISGMNDYHSVRAAFLNGAKDYLLKPVQSEELVLQIENVQGCLLKDREDEHYSQKSRNLLVANVMQKLLKGNGELEQKDIRDLQNLGVNTQFPCLFSIVVRADQYYKQYRDARQYEKKLDEDVQKILCELEEKKNFDYCFYISGQEIILLLFCEDGEQGEVISSRIFRALNKKSEELCTNSLGVSNAYFDIEKVRIAYQEAEDAVQARFYLGQNKCIHYRDIKEKYIDMQYNLEPLVKQFVHYLELCDYIKSKQILEQLFLDLSYSKPDKFRKCLHSLMEMLIVRIKNFDNALLLFAPDYQFQIDYLNTYRELKAFMNSVLQGAIEYIKGEREKRSKKRIELAKLYIEENCQNKITLNDVAEHVELNTSYFSNLFKAEVGMNFTDYLLNIRVEKAKKLLKDPKIKVYEIGNLVGYEDAVSFGRAFKKKLGMSPKEYRNAVY